MDFEDLTEKVQSSQAKMLILCSPHNPVGRVWSRSELERLSQICIEHDLIVVSDEIHADLVLTPHKHVPFTMIAPELEDRTIVCMAPSKTFNMAGLATSFIMIPNQELREKFNSYMEKAHLTMINPFSLTAADAAYRYGDDWLDQVLDYIKCNVEYLTDYIQRRISQLSVVVPEGTYLAW
ncbi:MAG: aminotransferase class, partial [Bacilli bacterium]|nr:aminotransferase class [Bacilli bacterium]